jgi:photosystem II stability/assembly factor-like uncharacterized protein
MKFPVAALVAVLSVPAISQQRPAARPAQAVVPTNYEARNSTALRLRHIGPVGNRVSAVVGIPGDASTYYAGAATGGIFKTTDAGLTWQSIFDDFAVSSIGALAIARSDANVVWAGTGEPHIRSHVSIGNGIYKSTDAGRTWRRMGLEESGRISRILIHPTNPDIVYAGVQGHGYGPQQMRGLFRTRDGGQTWQRILFVDENTGVSDMDMDPTNPNKIIVGMWQLLIRTWGRESGGPGSGLHVTTDGGDTFTKLTGNGLPTHTIGKIAVRIANSNPNRIYAQIETGDGVPYKGQPTDNGELWRSEDGGRTWKVVSYDRNLSCRQAYYTRMAVSTDNPDEVYFQCATFSRTIDGGVTNRGAGGGGGGAGNAGPAETPFTSPGGDHHDHWIDPTNANRMINGNDQNVAISNNRARSWLRINLPIAQMYHVTTDTRIPYYVYGNRQDGPSYRGPSNSRTGGGGGGGGGAATGFGSVLPRSEWHGVYGGESGMATPDPVDTNIIWSTASGSGARGGIVVRMDARSRHSQQVEVWPLSTGGHPAADLKYRFIWNAPFLISPHDHNRVYTGSQYVHQSTDGGRTWREISPDLTRNDKSKQQFSGGLTGDNIGVEYGGTLMSIAESRIRRGVMWSGSNDGQVHVTRDTAKTWTNVSPPLTGAAAWGSVKSIETSRWDAATAYITVEGHQEGDFGIHVFRTKDYGKTWTSIVNGVNPAVPGWANIIIEDPVRRGLLYLGTENALYVSYNDGDNWVRFNNNMPPAPVYGITVQEHFNDLVIATYGRGFWILDDITPFQQLTPTVLNAEAHLFAPRAAYRFRQIVGQYDQGNDASAGANPVYGAAINYWVKSPAGSPAKIEILDSTRKVVRTMAQMATVGINRIYWNFEGDTSRSARLLTKPEHFEDWEMANDGTRPGFGTLTVLLPPGRFSVRLTVNGVTQTQPLEVRKDPHGRVTIAEINAQFRALVAIQRDYNQAAEMTATIEKVRAQIQAMRGSAAADVRAAGDALEAKFKEVEGRILDLRITGRGQDGVRWPVRLAGQLQYVAQTIAASEHAPTASQREVSGVLAKETRDVNAALMILLNKDLVDHNNMLRSKGLKTIDAQPPVIP